MWSDECSEQSHQELWQTQWEGGTAFIPIAALPDRSPPSVSADGNRLTFVWVKGIPGSREAPHWMNSQHNNHIQRGKMPSLMPRLLPSCPALPKHGASADASSGGRGSGLLPEVAAAELLRLGRSEWKRAATAQGAAWCRERGRCPDQSREAGRKTHSQHSSLMTV